MFLLVASCLFCSNASAYDAEIDGIYYNLIESEGQAEVIRGYSGYLGCYRGTVTIPETVSHNGETYFVTSIGECAFYYCSGLTSVTIPNSVTSIGAYAFRD